MNEKQRAERALEALASIDTALADLEDAAYGREGDIDYGNDDLLEAIDRFMTAYNDNCDRTMYTYSNEVIAAPVRAIKAAAEARL